MAFGSRPSRSASSTGAGRDGGRAPGRDSLPSPPADPVEAARQICLNQLDHAPRTRAELAAVLRRKGVEDDVADRVLERFAEVGLIDDASFAQQWVVSRHRGKGLARRALTHELRRKGVADEAVAEALDGLDPELERATARSLVDRKLRTTTGLATQVRVRRLTGMLARKGYPAGTAFQIVREALAAEAEQVGRDVDDGIFDEMPDPTS